MDITWTEKFIFDEIVAGGVTPDIGSRSVHDNYKDRVRSFKFPGIEYSSTFVSRLAGLRKIGYKRYISS